MNKHRFTTAQVCFFIGMAILIISLALLYVNELIAFILLLVGYLMAGISASFRLYERMKEQDNWRNILK